MNKVLVIGGGYGGLRAIESLQDQNDIEIILVDQNPYHYLQTEAYGYIAGQLDVHDIAIDLQSWCEGFKRVKFIQTKITSVDFKAKVVYSQDEEITFDYAILAVGARTNFFSFIEGLRENSYGVKFLNRAFNFRKEFENLLYNKLNTKLSEKGQKFNIAIGGAGLSGVEVAAEMAYVLNNYEKTIGVRAKDINIYLIDASATILPGTSSFIIKNTKKRLEKLGVKILINAFISKVDSKKISFKEGEDLEYCFMIFTGGIKAPPLNEAIDCEKNRINQLVVDKTLNVSGYKNVFAIGDCVEMRDEHSKILPPTAQSAERSAEYVAKAIKTRIEKKEPEPFKANIMGMFVALGGKYAVGEVFKFIKVQGYTAYLLKKAITYGYYKGLKPRINTGFKNRIKNKTI
ncbi:MAG: pyridine nucleotide-disulfide oxidoreductase [Helicobacteraceae bacterium CG2_30_36_10]|nr:MAG: pyridine nucleotide-disulfide oxidoreductase [Helicobacteraceae bacterium CG2_30_36_10]